MRFFIGVFISDMSNHFTSCGEFRHTEFAPNILINVDIIFEPLKVLFCYTSVFKSF